MRREGDIVRPGLSTSDRLLITLIVVAASIFPVDLEPSPRQQSPGLDGQYSGRQGEVLLIPLFLDEAPLGVNGRFLGRRIPFFRDPRSDAPGEYLGLVGIDMLDAPGTHELVVEIAVPDRSRRLSYNILVVQERFPVQHLTLPKDQVDLDRKTLVRVRDEQRRVRKVLQTASERRLWRGGFIKPLEGDISGAFGRKRLINGQPRSPHSGEDISAPAGTDVLATNNGIVRLTADHFFSGKGVFLDHGLGLHSMYFHLSEVLVEEGQAVRRGQPIGRVGSTGRATGPHLHWGVRLNGARINPYALVDLPLDGVSPLH